MFTPGTNVLVSVLLGGVSQRLRGSHKPKHTGVKNMVGARPISSGDEIR